MTEFGEIFDRERGKKKFKYSRSPKRVLVKETAKIPGNAEPGKVIATIGRHHYVKPIINDKVSNEIIQCVTAGTIISKNKRATLVCVGDNIWFVRDEKNLSKDYPGGSIVKVEERKSSLARRAINNPSEDVLASNVDKLLILMAAADPFYNKRLIDRYLVTAELNSLEPAICINKIDLIKLDLIKNDFDTYAKLGIKVFFISSIKGTGLKSLKDYLKESNTVLSGPSGGGKSTLINKLLKEQVQAVQEISEKTFKGRHTTSYVQMFEMSNGGNIIDTPGIREFGIWGLEPNELSLYFHEFDEFASNCKYPGCTHIHEPGCAVLEALDNNLIDPERYESYFNMYETLNEQEDNYIF